ncbi:MAG: zinc metallopeptidase [Anaerolineales bacterium]|nr:zinc metallopeptidase [Anaerolineales bacterium]
MFFFDPLYLVFTIPALLFGLWAQWRVQSAVGKYSQVYTGRNATGAAVARAMLNAYGLNNVKVERTQGFLSDHYDPISRTLRLSPNNYDTPSVAAVGIAAHEAGHAIQHAENYWPLQARSVIVPVVQFGSFLGPLVFIGGFFLAQAGSAFGFNVAVVGVLMFGATALFSLITLPVEFDASRRAKEVLVNAGFVSADEGQGVNKVLDAAALTYVAALISALSTLLYYVFLLSGLRRSED